MKAFAAILLNLLWLPAATAVDRSDPSGEYGFGAADVSVIFAGDKAVAYYWGEHLNAGDRSCSCEYFFARQKDGTWRSTADAKVILRLDEKGLAIDDSEIGCCGSGVSAPSVRYAQGTMGQCRVTGKVPEVKAGTTVPAVSAPEWATWDGTPPDEGEPTSKHLIRARIGGVDKILLVHDSELSCTSANAEPSRPSLSQSHAAALALFKSGKVREAAQALGQAAGPKPWKVSKEDLTALNDWGFFLEQSKQYPEAIEVLSAVLAAFPDRTPAYLNQGDAYMGLGDKAKARAAYEHYADLMKKAGLDRKIPDRVKKALQE